MPIGEKLARKEQTNQRVPPRSVIKINNRGLGKNARPPRFQDPNPMKMAPQIRMIVRRKQSQPRRRNVRPRHRRLILKYA